MTAAARRDDWIAAVEDNWIIVAAMPILLAAWWCDAHLLHARDTWRS